MLIYVIRHGQTVSNKERRFQGQTECPLNESGIRLAVETGKNLRGVHFDCAVTSPLSRAKVTAELVLRESGNTDTVLRCDDRLMELHCGVCEGVLCDADTPYREMIANFFTNPLTYTPNGFPGGESIAACMARTQAVVREVAALPCETVLLSTHGCAVRAMLNMFYDDPADFWQGCVPPNCAVNIIEAKDGRLRLIEKDKLFYDPALCEDCFPVGKQH